MAENLPRIGSALLVRDEANRILLGKRNKDPQRGAWVIPGGKIRAFESIADAAVRELAEETGLQVVAEEQFRVYEILNPPTEHRIVIYSWGRVVGGTPAASDDLSELKFFDLRELGAVPTTPLVRRVLADAGLLEPESRNQGRPAFQLAIWTVPVLIAGAYRRSGQRTRRSFRPRRTGRGEVIDTSGLLFDRNLKSD